MRRGKPEGRGRHRPGFPTSLGGIAVCVALLGLAALPPAAQAQRTTMTLSATTLTFATPTIADYTAGYMCAGSITVSGTADNVSHSDTLFIRAVTASTTIASTIAGETKLLSDYQFNMDPAGCAATSLWTSIPPQTAAPAIAYETGPYQNTTIAGPVYFRLVLDWASDRGGATYTLPPIRFFVNRSLTIPPPP